MLCAVGDVGRVWRILQHLLLSLQLADQRQLALCRWEFKANNFNFVFSIDNREVTSGPYYNVKLS